MQLIDGAYSSPHTPPALPPRNRSLRHQTTSPAPPPPLPPKPTSSHHHQYHSGLECESGSVPRPSSCPMHDPTGFQTPDPGNRCNSSRSAAPGVGVSLRQRKSSRSGSKPGATNLTPPPGKYETSRHHRHHSKTPRSHPKIPTPPIPSRVHNDYSGEPAPPDPEVHENYPELDSPNSCFNGDNCSPVAAVKNTGIRAKLTKFLDIFRRPDKKSAKKMSPHGRSWSSTRVDQTSPVGVPPGSASTKTPRRRRGMSHSHSSHGQLGASPGPVGGSRFSPVHLRTSPEPAVLPMPHPRAGEAHRHTEASPKPERTPSRRKLHRSSRPHRSKTVEEELKQSQSPVTTTATHQSSRSASTPIGENGEPVSNPGSVTPGSLHGRRHRRSSSRHRNATLPPSTTPSPALLGSGGTPVEGERRPETTERRPRRCGQSPSTLARGRADGGREGVDERTITFMENMNELKKMGWYWGPLSFEEAEQLLEDRRDGTFLVRDSAHDSFILSLSFRARGSTYHTRIEHSPGKFNFWAQPECHSAATIVQFIEKAVEHTINGKFHYFLQTSVPGQPHIQVSLLHPLSRLQVVASLQHISRFEILRHVRRDLVSYLPLPPTLTHYLDQKQYYVESLSTFMEETRHHQPLNFVLNATPSTPLLRHHPSS